MNSIDVYSINKSKKENRPNYMRAYNRYLKRFIDITLAFVALVLLIPLYLIISLAIIIFDGFPILYRPLRGGYNGKPFRVFKYRTMVKNADKIGGGTTALNDSRITPIGRILRKTKLDELPQILNVLLGSMSFVGPRPELLKYTDQYTDNERDILLVKPGITDYSSIEYINLDEVVGGTDADEKYEEFVLKRKNALRIRYAHEVSFLLDCKLFLKTISSVFAKCLRSMRKE